MCGVLILPVAMLIFTRFVSYSILEKYIHPSFIALKHAYQSLACETAIDTENPWEVFPVLKKRSQKGKQTAHRLKSWVNFFLWNAFIEKCKNAILPHIDCSCRTSKDLIYDHVFFQIFIYYVEPPVQGRKEHAVNRNFFCVNLINLTFSLANETI